MLQNEVTNAIEITMGLTDCSGKEKGRISPTVSRLEKVELSNKKGFQIETMASTGSGSWHGAVILPFTKRAL